jgi:hypothetical protein
MYKESQSEKKISFFDEMQEKKNEKKKVTAQLGGKTCII